MMECAGITMTQTVFSKPADGQYLQGDSAGALAEFAKPVAALVEQIGQPQFAPALNALLGSNCALESLVITAYDAAAAPRTLFSTVANRSTTLCIDEYLQGPYKLDPFFLACVHQHRAGVWRLSELAPDQFRRTAYYLNFYRRLHQGEEVGIVLTRGSSAGIVLSLESAASSEQFGDGEIGRLRALFPIIDSAAHKHWGKLLAPRAQAASDLVDGLLALFGEGVLSPREQKVVELILQGHSSASICQALSIAVGTVKLHRKHAYRKLGIASQAQLFQRFMATLPLA